VPNHSSDQHEWFLKSERREDPYTDYYIWKDRNESNPVIQEMKDVLTFWIEKGVDGFRMDAVPFLFEDEHFRDEPLSHITTDSEDYLYLVHIYTWNYPKVREVLAEFTQLVHEQTDNEGVVMLEVPREMIVTSSLMKYYNCSDFPFNFGFIVDLTALTLVDGLSGHHLETVVYNWLKFLPENKIANWVLGNHDYWRVGSRFGEGNIDGFNMLSLLLPGVSVTYQGEEIGMMNTDVSWEDTVDPAGRNCGEEHFNDIMCSRDPERTPMQWDTTENAGFSNNTKPWLPVNSNYLDGVNVQDQSEEGVDSHLRVFKQMMQLRQARTLSETFLLSTKEVFSVLRHGEEVDFILVMNVKENMTRVNLDALLQNIPANSTEAEVVVRSSGFGWTGNVVGKIVNLLDLELQGYEAAIMKLL